MKTDPTRGGNQAESEHVDLPQPATGDSSEALAPMVEKLIQHSESFIRLARTNGHDLREDACRILRNTIAEAKAALREAGGHDIREQRDELLAALKQIRDFYDNAGTAEHFACGFDIATVSAAIAKAEGR